MRKNKSQKIIIPKGTANPDEDMIIEIPGALRKTPEVQIERQDYVTYVHPREVGLYGTSKRSTASACKGCGIQPRASFYVNQQPTTSAAYQSSSSPVKTRRVSLDMIQLQDVPTIKDQLSKNDINFLQMCKSLQRLCPVASETDFRQRVSRDDSSGKDCKTNKSIERLLSQTVIGIERLTEGLFVVRRCAVWSHATIS